MPPIYAIPGFAEPVSSLTHLLAAPVFSLLGVYIVARAAPAQRIWVAIFLVAAVFLLSMSGVYHLLSPGGFAREEVLRRLDHSAIFVMIAATFTACHGLLFRGGWRWGMIGLLWAGAATAITVKSVYFHQIADWVGLTLYLAFGWLGLVSGYVLWRRYGFTFIRPLLYGGLAYTVGAAIDASGQAAWIPGVFGAHELFHLMVLAGLALHCRFIVRIPAQDAL